jgi:DtxR family Mn-dependent transcriptional regulator
MTNDEPPLPPLYCCDQYKEFRVASLTIENYVKTVYQTCVGQGNSPAGTGQIATALGVSPGTVTSMLKTLSESGLAEYTPYEGVRLTESGRNLALRVLRRHRLIELFLAQTLELSWDEVHEEAENMEHAVSDHLIDRIEKFLGYPTTDPHGDPIPRADGTIEITNSRSLAEAAVGELFRLVRVLDQSPEFLRYLSESGLSLGVEGEVAASRSEAGIVTIRIDGADTTLARDIAEKLLIGSPDRG